MIIRPINDKVIPKSSVNLLIEKLIHLFINSLISIKMNQINNFVSFNICG